MSLRVGMRSTRRAMAPQASRSGRPAGPCGAPQSRPICPPPPPPSDGAAGASSDAERLPGFTDGLEEGDTVEVGRCTARVLFIPAHTRGHIAYVFDDAKAVFCGDTLFAGGCGRLFEGTPEMMYDAMRKLGALPDDTRVYCGHEYTVANLTFAAHAEPDNDAVKQALAAAKARREKAAPDWHDAGPDEMTVPSTIADEHATNPFMRADGPEELGRRRAAKDSF
ncbi:MAG: hydroxyacylglutathione hydrolase C-terminal domain-containing protein [Myxococcota bacterium]|nr:hydroxyacylglutathione hydrolase C-terminal domain-containing protein [Myxococcota bacterium]